MANANENTEAETSRRPAPDWASEREGGLDDVSRFDPARDREAMHRRADRVADAAVDGEIDVYEGEYAGREEAFEDGYGSGYEHGYTEGFLAGFDARPGLGERFEWNSAGITDASGRGASFALIAALLAAVGYYGLVGIQSGATELGSALPTPFYLLAFAVLSAVEWDARANARAYTQGRARLESGRSR
jgi:hypothetical protein